MKLTTYRARIVSLSGKTYSVSRQVRALATQIEELKRAKIPETRFDTGECLQEVSDAVGTASDLLLAMGQQLQALEGLV